MSESGSTFDRHILRKHARVLCIDGDRDTIRLLDDVGANLVREVDHAASMSQVISRLDQSSYDVLIVDRSSEDLRQRLHLCRYLAEQNHETAVVVIGDVDNMETAVAAMRSGAFDLVTKPLTAEKLEDILVRAVSQAMLERRLQEVREDTDRFETMGIYGRSSAVRRMTDRIKRVGSTEVTVLITGESGTGKELVARALHDNSERADGPFVPVNCAAIPAELLEGELFGHAKGAFTDAKRDKAGLFLEANDGTLFLDEIGEMPLEMQVKLLRALQERQVRPVGGEREIPFNARIVAATNRVLEDEVEAGNFREDLYYRLNVVRIATPPLRMRGSDVLLLAQHFVECWAEQLGRAVQSVSIDAARMLMRYDWPGNVRELENVIQRAVAMAKYDEIVPSDIGELHHANHEAGDVNSDRVHPASAVEASSRIIDVTTPVATASGVATLAPEGDLANPERLEELLAGWMRGMSLGTRLPDLAELERIYCGAVLKAHQGDEVAAAHALRLPLPQFLAKFTRESTRREYVPSGLGTGLIHGDADDEGPELDGLGGDGAAPARRRRN